MKRKVYGLAISAAMLAFVLSGSISIAGDVDLEKRISLNLKEAQLQQVLGLFGDILAVPVDVDPAIDTTITISFDEITVRTSLNAICESAKCRWELVDGEPALLRFERDDRGDASPADIVATHEAKTPGYKLDSPVSLQLSDANATTVLESVSQIIGARLLMDVKLEGKTVTVNAEAVPLSTILDTICDDLGCAWKLAEEAPPTLHVFHP